MSAIGEVEGSMKWVDCMMQEEKRTFVLEIIRRHLCAFVWQQAARLDYNTYGMTLDHVVCVCTTGSTFTNTHDIESDIDLLLITGNWLERDTVLWPDAQAVGSLAHYFAQAQLPSNVCISYVSLDQCHVPVFKIDVTIIDLTKTTITTTIRVDVTLATLPATLLSNKGHSQILKRLLELQSSEPQRLSEALDPKSRLSLAAYWSCMYMLQMVPDVYKFCKCVHFIRLWARRRGIYSQMLGYPGGTAWALLVARACLVCDAHNVSVSQLITRVFAHWFHGGQESLSPLIVRVPGSDANATSQVDSTTFKIIQAEWRRAVYMTSGRYRSPRLRARLLSLSPHYADESHLILRPVFFKERRDFHSYVQVTFTSPAYALDLVVRNQIMRWRECVKSRLLHGLVEPLRRIPNLHAVLWPVPSVSECKEDEHVLQRTTYSLGVYLTAHESVSPFSTIIVMFQVDCNALASRSPHTSDCDAFVHLIPRLMAKEKKDTTAA
jgi:hypothetical protein